MHVVTSSYNLGGNADVRNKSLIYLSLYSQPNMELRVLNRTFPQIDRYFYPFLSQEVRANTTDLALRHDETVIREACRLLTSKQAQFVYALTNFTEHMDYAGMAEQLILDSFCGSAEGRIALLPLDNHCFLESIEKIQTQSKIEFVIVEIPPPPSFLSASTAAKLPSLMSEKLAQLKQRILFVHAQKTSQKETFDPTFIQDLFAAFQWF